MTAKRKTAASTKLAKNARFNTEQRGKLSTQMRSAYESGKSVREIAAEHGRSFGSVHSMLAESGVTFRGRGGARK